MNSLSVIFNGTGAPRCLLRYFVCQDIRLTDFDSSKKETFRRNFLALLEQDWPETSVT